jgi:protease II
MIELHSYAIFAVIIIGISSPKIVAAQENCFRDGLRNLMPLQDHLDQAAVDAWSLIKKSKNYKPISDFLMEQESPIKRIVLSPQIDRIGRFKLENNLNSGSSSLEIIDPILKNGNKIFDTKDFARIDQWGHVDSITLSSDQSEVTVLYRAYKDKWTGLKELRYRLPESMHLSVPNPKPKVVIRNYKEILTVKTDNGVYSLRNYGWNKSTDVIFEGENGTRKVVYSNFENYKNNLEAISSISVSPNEKYLVIKTSLKGSQDLFDIKVYDCATEKLIENFQAGNADISWNGNKITVPSRDSYGRFTYLTGDLSPSTIKPIDSTSVVGTFDSKLVYLKKNILGDLTDLNVLDTTDLDSLLKTHKGTLLFQAKDGYLISSATKIGNSIGVLLKKGAEMSQTILDVDGKELARIEIPESVNLYKTEWKENGKTLNLRFRSSVNASLNVAYDIATKTFTPADFEKLLLTRNKREYISHIIEAPSEDGTLIPVRITHLKDLPLTGKNPVFMNTYGGFGTEDNNFRPSFDAIKSNFLERGGVLATPAVRGGNEFGEAWHTAAINLNKRKTIEDVVATANYLIQHGYTEPKKVILSGASNGGFVTAASGLKSPESFGLVIPINGVLDFANAETLDRNFNGWNHEYGYDVIEDQKRNKVALSPVENAKHRNQNVDWPEFLIVNGRDDTRVNPLHSQEFYKQLKDSHSVPEKVNLLISPNAGHFSTSSAYGKAIGWNSKSMIWTRIYDFLGWDFKDPPK